jgi:hypothetical protein
VGAGLAVGAGVAVGFGVAIGVGDAVGAGVAVATGVVVGFGDAVGAGLAIGAGKPEGTEAGIRPAPSMLSAADLSAAVTLMSQAENPSALTPNTAAHVDFRSTFLMKSPSHV